MNTKLLASISVAGNVALLVFGLRIAHGPSAGPAAAEGAKPATVEMARFKTNLTRIALTETNEAAPFSWASVYSGDFKLFASNLLVVGCPPETIRAILEREAWQQFLPRRRLLLEPFNRRYWDLAASGTSLEKASDSIRGELVKLKKETIDQLDGIVGVEVAEKERQIQYPVYDFLPAEKRRAIADLETAYAAEMKALTNSKAPEAQAKRDQAKTKMEKGIQALMTPEELANLDLRRSSYVARARSSAGFEPTLEESREVTRIYQQFEVADAKIDRKAPDADARRAQAAAAKKQREESLKQSLGEERYAQFKQGEDSNFGEIYRITERYELPRDAAARAAEVLKARNTALGQMRKGTSPQELEERSLALNDATRAEMLSVLGERALRTYEKYHGPIIPVPEPVEE